MRQNRSVLGEIPKACVRLVREFDAKMDDFVHTPSVRDAFTRKPRRKCSKLQTVTCALLLAVAQNRSRLNSVLILNRP